MPRSTALFACGILAAAGWLGVAWSGADDAGSDAIASLGDDSGAGGGSDAGDVSTTAEGAPVGLSLWFDNGEVRLMDGVPADGTGTPKTVTLYGSAPRFIRELDITSTTTTSTDQGIDPVINAGDMAGLDWSGVELAEVDWKPNGNGTYQRTRFYRGARWMEAPSYLTLLPVMSNGYRAGPPIRVYAGVDDRHSLLADDFLVRRFVARQITPVCTGKTDDSCASSTTYIAEALAELRDEEHPAGQTRSIPASAVALELRWSADPGHVRTVAIDHGDLDAQPFGYGFNVEASVLTDPGPDGYFLPGEPVEFRITMTDGAGRRLHDEGSLPTYLEFLTDSTASGIRYSDNARIRAILFYANKHREGLMIWSLAGPADKLKNSDHIVPLADFALPQIPSATVAEQGFSGAFQTTPSRTIRNNPLLWSTPVPDTVTFTIPADALPGTYVLAVKARRDWGGQALNRGDTVDLQVGTTALSEFRSETPRCNLCHRNDIALGNVLHGLSDRRACLGCHAPLSIEPDNALDYRVHLVHTRSQRFSLNPDMCMNCHRMRPDGPARGFPGIPPHGED